MLKLRILNIANMSFSAIRENKIHTKISESTVFVCFIQQIISR